jgi:hypothetical protein
MSHKAKLVISTTLATAAFLLACATLFSSAGAEVRSLNISCSEDVDAKINSDPQDTATRFVLKACTYEVSQPVILKDGDELVGPEGKTAEEGPAIYGKPKARLVGGTVDRVISANGSNIIIEWVDISGAKGEIDYSEPSSSCPASPLPSGCPVVGTGVGIAMGSADGTAVVQYVNVHDNDAAGIANAAGRITHSHFTRNTNLNAFLGVNASAIKGIREFEAAFNYVHDEQGNGIWHDHSLSTEGDVPEMSSNPGGGTWVHDNVTVDNERWGIRYENAPRDAQEGEHLPTPTFLAEDNRIAANGYGGASVVDAQNAEWRENIFGPQVIGKTSYPGNANGLAMRIHDSGGTWGTRTDIWNISVHDNTLNDETITGCSLPAVTCQ